LEKRQNDKQFVPRREVWIIDIFLLSNIIASIKCAVR